jgi:hypothetical protein
MWKEEGLTVLEVDSGEWDAVPKKAPGKLFMMVGPSGAGKSTFAGKHFAPDMVVSSDVIRERMTGDPGDQSKNAEVYAALHAIVKTRIKHGLSTVVDSTNLRARDRRAIRDVVPQDTQITYIVIDRPLTEKIRDGGWRLGVDIDGVPLMSKHARTFQSGLKHILAGDSDPRVTVEDLRKS